MYTAINWYTAAYELLLPNLAAQDAPQTVSVDFALTRALRVSWTPPSIPTGVILTYEVVYEGTAIDTLGVRSVNASTGRLFRTIILLEEAETYSIQVRARYQNGSGPLSVPVQGTTLEDGKPNIQQS